MYETLCCACEKALSVQLDGGGCHRERKVQCSKILHNDIDVSLKAIWSVTACHHSILC